MRIEASAVAVPLPPRVNPPVALRSPGAPAEAPAPVLSADELAYFAELERMGPLVYDRRRAGAGTTPPPVLGHRIDVKA